MLNAVLHHEMLLGSRRNKNYWLRWVLAGWLLLQWGSMFLVAVTRIFPFQEPLKYTDFGDFCRSYCELFVWQHFLVLLLATPTLTAGAITDEKTTGTLQYLLTAAMEPWEIILGKALGRLYQVGLLALTGLPLLCFFGVFGGLDPARLLVVIAATLLVTFALAGMSVFASVRSRHTRDAVLGLYAVLAGGWLLVALVLPPLASVSGIVGQVAGGLLWFLNLFNPFALLREDWTQETLGDLGERFFLSGLAWFGLGAGCLAVAVHRLRGTYQRYLEGAGKKKKQHWWTATRKPVSDNPLVWKERHVEGIAPLAILRGIPTGVGLALVFFGTLLLDLWLVVDDWQNLTNVASALFQGDALSLKAAYDGLPMNTASFYWQGVVVVLMAGLVVAIRCSGAVSGEREKQTWEALLLTPLETRQLVRGKLWGIIGASLPYLAAYAIPALAFSAIAGVAAFMGTVVWTGLTLLTVAFVGAAGLWCSVKAKTSWRSLLGSLAISYLGGAVLFGAGAFVAFILAAVITLLLLFVDRLTGAFTAGTFLQYLDWFFTLLGIATAALFALLAWALINSAEYRVSILERTKHWRNEPSRLPTLQPRAERRPPVANAQPVQPPLYQIRELE